MIIIRIMVIIRLIIYYILYTIHYIRTGALFGLFGCGENVF
jgi:hypothetical protein